MFEVGKLYEIHMIELTSDGPTEGYHAATVLEIDGNLVKVSHPKYAFEILNTASHHFVKAVLLD